MDKSTNRTVKRFIRSVAKQQPGLIAAYIFGSYAKNKQLVDSDMDIALVIENLSDNERFDTQVKLMLIASQIDNRIEPHPISKQDLISNNPFAVEIRRTGIELKVK
jgi:predicted nucleotidyltransferase